MPPFWASRACPKSAKICQDSLASWPFFFQRSPQELPDPLQASIFSFQGRFFKLSKQIFVGFSVPVSTFLDGLLKEADRKGQAGKKGAGGTRRRRLRYPPPPRSGEPGVFESGVQSCQILLNPFLKTPRGVLRPLPVAPAARIPCVGLSLFPLKLAILGHLRPNFSQHLAKKLPT